MTGHGRKGIDTYHALQLSRVWSPAKAADTIRNPCWQWPDLTWKHSRFRRAGHMAASVPSGPGERSVIDPIPPYRSMGAAALLSSFAPPSADDDGAGPAVQAGDHLHRDPCP
jgi:hypothetical protein